MLGSTFLFAVENPPFAAQIVAASGVVRYFTSASTAGVSLNVITVSPPPITTGGELLINGNTNTLNPLSGLAFVDDQITRATKSPSNTIAAFGGCVNTSDTEVGKSFCRAAEVPPAMLDVSPTTFAISVSADVTDGSVHGMAWVDSLSYMSGPACRR